MNITSILSRKDAAQQQKIIESGIGCDAYLFAKDVKGADREALQYVVLEYGDGLDVTNFARYVKGADIQALQQAVLNRGDGYAAHAFAFYIDGADIPSLQRVVLDRGDGWNVYYFAADICGADLNALRNRLVELHSTGQDALGFLDKFNKDSRIQNGLKARLAAASHSEPEGNTGRQKHSLT